MQDFYKLVNICILLLLISAVCGTDKKHVYTNKFALEFHGGLDQLESFAKEHGYTLRGQVIDSFFQFFFKNDQHVY